MYQALYRKYRPGTFEDVVGQEHVTKTLRRQIETGRLSHAYLFVGTRGTGKTTCARILAKAANCEHPVNGNPCNQCASCRGIDSGAILDVEELDAASNSSVDNIRALRDEAIYTPTAVRKRVYIVDEVHMLSSAAFNALLKILEEPPEHIIFILATTEIQKVLPTILSRCQRFTFRRLTPTEIAGRLEEVARREGLDLRPEAAELLSRMADGGMRDGLSLLDQCVWDGPIDVSRVNDAIGLVGAEDTCRLAEYLTAGEAAQALELLGRLYSAGKSLEAILEELCALLRDTLVLHVAPKGGGGLLSGAYSMDALERFKRRLPGERLLSAVSIVQTTLNDLGRTADKRTAAEVCIIRLCRPELNPDGQALAGRIAALEEKLASGCIPAISAPAPAAPPPPAPEPVRTEEELPPWEEVPPPAEPEPQYPRAEAVPPPAETEPAVPASPVPSASAAPADGEVWQKVLERVKPDIPMPDILWLTDRSHIEGAYTDGVLTVCHHTALGAATLEKPSVAGALKSAASAITGTPVQLHTGAPMPVQTGSGRDKLEELAKFGNVTFT